MPKRVGANKTESKKTVLRVATVMGGGRMKLPRSVMDDLVLADGDLVAFIRRPSGVYEIYPARRLTISEDIEIKEDR